MGNYIAKRLSESILSSRLFGMKVLGTFSLFTILYSLPNNRKINKNQRFLCDYLDMSFFFCTFAPKFVVRIFVRICIRTKKMSK